MGLSHMKEELHQRLWAAQERWMEWRAKGETKRGLKLEGLREFGDSNARLRYVIPTGNTRKTYERELKRFVEFAHEVRGKTENRLIDGKDFKAYVEYLLAQGMAAKEISKAKSALVKFGVLYGKAESFAALSRKYGRRVRRLLRAGVLAPPDRPHVTPQVREAVIARLKELDGTCRAYHLVVRLQKEASLRAIEATERFTRECLLGVEGEAGLVRVVGKGGRPRTAPITRDLYAELAGYFGRTSAPCLADRDAYRQALRRATLFVGGRSTGSHAHRRTSASELKDSLYWRYAQEGLPPGEARQRAVEDTVEHLGHSRCRKDVAQAYLS